MLTPVPGVIRCGLRRPGERDGLPGSSRTRLLDACRCKLLSVNGDTLLAAVLYGAGDSKCVDLCRLGAITKSGDDNGALAISRELMRNRSWHAQESDAAERDGIERDITEAAAIHRG